MNDANTKMSANKEKKVAIVAEVAEKVNKAKAMVFTNFTGLTHKQLEEFKREIRAADAEFAATKNTLLKRALGDKAISGNEDKFQQPTGTIFMYGDVAQPLKALAKMMKDLEKPTVKFGLMDGKVLTEADVKKLATLPSKEVLIAQMLGMMNAPIQGLHRALSWNLQKFVMTLSAVAKKKESMPAAATPAPTASQTAPAAEETSSDASSSAEASKDKKAMDDKPAATEAVSEPVATTETTETATPAETAAVVTEQASEEPTAAESTEEKAVEESNA